MPSWEEIRNGIFAGESGGDYGALYGFSNRPGGKFANVSIPNMTVDEAIEFTKPGGPYAQWVKSQIGRIATPVGAYQIVGDTLREAKKWASLTGSEKMNEATQDALGKAILANQGTGAWAGYKGPRTKALRHVGGAGSGPQHFTDSGVTDEPATTPAGDTVTPPVGDTTKPKTWNEALGAGFQKMGEAMKFDPINISGQAPVDFSGGQPMPSVYRPQFAPTQVQAGVGGMGGGDMRQLLAMLMQGRM